MGATASSIEGILTRAAAPFDAVYSATTTTTTALSGSLRLTPTSVAAMLAPAPAYAK